MSRDFYLNGPSLVKVKGGAHLGTTLNVGKLTELGLSSEGIEIDLSFHHRKLIPDDYGPIVPAELMTDLAEARIRMTLIHFDYNVLDICLGESLGGDRGIYAGGQLPPAGTIMGGGGPIFSSGNHFISLNILSEYKPQTLLLGIPWRFPACYLSQPPVHFPLGTKCSAVGLTWTAFPYSPFGGTTIGTSGSSSTLTGEILSSGAVLWTRTLDT